MRVLVVLAFILIQCREALNFESGGFEEFLVVEGHITTERKTHRVRLTNTAIFGSIFQPGGNIEGIEGATVIVRSDDGQNVILTDAGGGYYETNSDFSAEVGKAYNLLIELANGESYASIPETVRPATPVDSISYQYKELPLNNAGAFASGFEITVYLQDPSENRDFYLWQHEGLYELNTFPELHETVIREDDLPPMTVPDPKGCCAKCWRNETFPEQVVESDKFFDGSNYQRPVLFIRDDGLRFFNEKYLVRVKQHLISSEAFDFLTLIQSQIAIDGDIFDPPPATVTGNLISIDNPNELVIGYFWAADVSVDSLFISSEDLLETIPQTVIKDDCRVIDGATDVKPVFW